MRISYVKVLKAREVNRMQLVRVHRAAAERSRNPLFHATESGCVLRVKEALETTEVITMWFMF